MALLQIKNYFMLRRMIEDRFDIKALLDFYIAAGVDETCGDRAFAMQQPSLKNETRSEVASITRSATSHLALAAAEAVKNAAEICQNIITMEELRQAIEKFDGCALKNTAAHTVIGDGNPEAKVMFIGEAPGADEDRIGRAFVGRSGQLLDKMLASIGLDRDKCYICNILPWRPPGNRAPVDAEIAVCLPFLKKQIELVNPDYIFALGAVAANTLLDNAESISRLRGKWLEYETAAGKKVKVLAGYHPAYLLRTPAQKAKAWADFLRLKKAKDENN